MALKNWTWLLLGGLAALAARPSRAGVLLSDRFGAPDGLITNEYAYWNPDDPKAARSETWEMDSGSLFARDGAGWTGVPDDKTPDARSSNGNNSAVFRLTTKRSDFGDVSVSFSLRNEGLAETPSTPAQDWDGLHVWLRYQSQTLLYYASVNRRDNTVVIKKKVPGGPSNGGTYYPLSGYVPYRVPYKIWQRVKATVKNNADGSVTLALYVDGRLLVSATDDGVGGPPLRKGGKVGLRGDNAEFVFSNFSVAPLTAAGHWLRTIEVNAGRRPTP